MIEPRLGYTYAIIDEDGCCYACRTYNIEIPLENYIPVTRVNEDYLDKYYNRENGMWYWDSSFTQLWEECPSHNV